MSAISGSSVLITGGGSGLGEAISRHFVKLGARVTIAGRRPDKIEAVAQALGSACIAVTADVSVAEDRRRLVDAAQDHGAGLTTLVNAAGNMYRGWIDELEEEMIVDLFRTNVVGPMMLIGAALPALRQSRGNVILFGSVHTQRAFPGASPYAATKGALETLTGVLASETGRAGVRVNCIRPGAVHTEINQRAGLGTAQETLERLQGLSSAHVIGNIGTGMDIAEGAAYLATADWVTGAVLTIDGGLALGVTNA